MLSLIHIYCPYPLSVSIPAMMIGHITLFGLAEIILTVVVLTFVEKVTPKDVYKRQLVTIITLLMLSVGNLLGGTAIVESIFMWDGVGKMAVDAISMRDYPIIQAYVMWMAIIYVVVNLLTDLSYRFLDPRIRLGGVKQ